MVVACYDWSGFYIGAQRRRRPEPQVLGPRTDRHRDLGGPVGHHSRWLKAAMTASGGTIGGQIGYRWQASSWVFGLEAQGNWADLHADPTSAVIFFAG